MKTQRARQNFWPINVSGKRMAKSRRGAGVARVWLKCFRGVANVPQAFPQNSPDEGAADAVTRAVQGAPLYDTTVAPAVSGKLCTLRGCSVGQRPHRTVEKCPHAKISGARPAVFFAP